MSQGIEDFHKKGGVVKQGTTQILESTSPGSGVDGNEWVKFRDKRHRKGADKWEFVDDHYTGECVEAGKVDRYIPRKITAEPEEDYEERVLNLAAPTEFPFLVDSFAGMSEAADRNTKLELAPDGSTDGFGDMYDPASLGYRLLENTDGDGKNWKPFWSQFDNRIIRYFEMWVLVEGILLDRNDPSITVKDPHIRLINPVSVTNTRYDNGKLVEAVVEHFADTRTSIAQDPTERKRWTVYALEGWCTYEERKGRNNENEISEVAEGYYAYYDSADRRSSSRCLPLFRTTLPMDRFVSYQAAKRQNSILKKESERNAALSNGNIARLVISGGTGFYETVMKYAAKGYKILRGDPSNATPHYYIAPPDGPPRLTTDVIREERENFYVTNFRDYANAAREKTATEIKSDHRAGKEAFLYLISTAKTEAQRRSLFLLEQANFPENPALWGRAYIERDPDFSLVTGKELIDTILEKVLVGQPIQLGAMGLIDATTKVLDYFGIKYDEVQIQNAVEAKMASDSQASAAESAFGL
jgi:hypothetical protein